MIARVLSAAVVAIAMTGCVVAPSRVAGPGASYPSGGWTSIDDQYDEVIPPMEYVEGGEVMYYDATPGIAYYPIFINTPGSCHCIVPVRYVRGRWVSVDGFVHHHGMLVYERPHAVHRDVWLRHRGVVRDYVPVRGTLTVIDGRPRAVAPPGTVHVRPIVAPSRSTPVNHPPAPTVRNAPPPPLAPIQTPHPSTIRMNPPDPNRVLRDPHPPSSATITPRPQPPAGTSLSLPQQPPPPVPVMAPRPAPVSPQLISRPPSSPPVPAATLSSPPPGAPKGCRPEERAVRKC